MDSIGKFYNYATLIIKNDFYLINDFILAQNKPSIAIKAFITPPCVLLFAIPRLPWVPAEFPLF